MMMTMILTQLTVKL